MKKVEEDRGDEGFEDGWNVELEKTVGNCGWMRGEE